MKIDRSLSLIVDALKQARRPCVLWSGGKDSTVLLHLARAVRPDIECVFWTVPYMRHKLDFAQRLAAEWALTVHDAPPAQAALCAGNGRIDVLESYPLKGEGQTLLVARGTEQHEAGKPFVCGLDWLDRPKSVTAFPFDVALHGHKSVDIDPCSGPVPLQLDVYQWPGGGTEVVFPIRDWSDADVWNYTREHAVPYDTARYNADGGSNPDKGGNSDYFHACFACCDPSQGDFVSCPKRAGRLVNSVAGRVQHYQPRLDYINLRQDQPLAKN